MFTKFRVRNFKTHLDTEIELKDLGKTLDVIA